MKKSQIKKPKKKTDGELYHLLETKIVDLEYIILEHAKHRLKDRSIIEIEVLDILEGKEGRKRKRNKIKDKYDDGRQDWNYCIEGYNLDDLKIRIIISFEDDYLLVITVIDI